MSTTPWRQFIKKLTKNLPVMSFELIPAQDENKKQLSVHVHAVKSNVNIMCVENDQWFEISIEDDESTSRALLLAAETAKHNKSGE